MYFYRQLFSLGLLCLCLHTHSFTVTSPGGDTVFLNCSYPNGSSMLWYRRLPDQPPQPLLKTFSSKSLRFTFYIESEGHFTVKENHTLVIHNVSSNDTATYYCARLETDVCRFAEGIDLRVDDSDKSPKNCDIGKNQKNLGGEGNFVIWQLIFLALSLSLNLFLFLWLATEKKWLPCGRLKKVQESQQSHPENDLHYAEVVSAENRKKRNEEVKINTTYAEVQMRKAL